MQQHSEVKVTVGIPVYNGLPHLKECIESLKDQTCQDFTVLAIDDGSTDDSLSYLQSLRWPRLKVVQQSNRGLVFTLNRMLQEVNTPWLIRQDADDVSYPNRIAKLCEAVRNNPSAAVIHSLAEYYPAGASVGRFRSTCCSPEKARELVSSGYLLCVCHPTAALNVDKVKGVGGYRDLKHVEDADLWWRVALREDVCCIPEVLFGFRQNSESVSSQNLREQMLQALYVQYLLLSELQGKIPLDSASVRGTLLLLFSERDFQAREALRSFNMCLANQRCFAASKEFLRGVWHSPRYVASRVGDELTRRVVTSGVKADRFYEHAKELWPD
jgi:glycosyltransferase involved in cell wall biosynthesis